MGQIDFEFKRERKLGEFVQDFINLLKVIYKHLVIVLFRLLVIPICLVVLIGYYLSTQMSMNANHTNIDYFNVGVSVVSLVLLIMLVSLFAFGFAIEYFILLRNRKNISFTSKDIWLQFRNHIYYYLRFFIAMLVVGVLISIPAALSILLSAFIPIVGSFASGIIFAIIGLWFFSAFMLYRENYVELIDCFGSSFRMLKKKIFEYGLASYVVSFIFQALLSIITIMPLIIAFVIAYNFIGFDNDFFESGLGRAMATFGGLVVVLLFIVYYMLSVISYGIIYETAKELQYGEDVFERIEKLGGSSNA
ncbi:ABC transporter permease [Sphingobacterium bovistauri]|uniref:ABC transporter permease n=1 Tax=Sphingobacterium bovistauri TaxID=2781959 RepID=A0ABS7Z7A3_9SPHI|nr:ABC transporter permease [Sphingobacterium bovistauri]MCA5005868.1 ABC transporter permease [Sphingobacterium bovistauri]